MNCRTLRYVHIRFHYLLLTPLNLILMSLEPRLLLNSTDRWRSFTLLASQNHTLTTSAKPQRPAPYRISPQQRQWGASTPVMRQAGSAGPSCRQESRTWPLVCCQSYGEGDGGVLYSRRERLVESKEGRGWRIGRERLVEALEEGEKFCKERG